LNTIKAPQVNLQQAEMGQKSSDKIKNFKTSAARNLCLFASHMKLWILDSMKYRHRRGLQTYIEKHSVSVRISIIPINTIKCYLIR
jgi:hypothetical protein